jgi:hypothetical protein
LGELSIRQPIEEEIWWVWSGFKCMGTSTLLPKLFFRPDRELKRSRVDFI